MAKSIAQLSPGRALLQIELNEFDPKFMRREAERLGLRNLLTVLNFNYHSTTTDDDVEHQGLDPWVQWVNVHTGKPSTLHGVKRLGETERQRGSETQIWEHLSQQGLRWAAWGVMNAPGGDLTNCEAFMPDPWSFEESAHPPRLNDILALPRYMARNYTDMSKTALEFSKIRRKTKPDYSVIFLNHIAHLQHQFWLKGDEVHPEMELGLKVSDLIIGLLLETRRENEAVVVLNGLRQMNVHGQGVYVYRQTNPTTTMEALIGPSAQLGDWTVDQLMTNDAHVHFSDKSSADRAEALLTETVLSTGEPIFFVERLGNKHVFCQVRVEHFIPEDTLFSNAERGGRVFDIFETICERTGAHLQEGDVFTDGIAMSDHFYNHEVYNYTVNHFSETVNSA